MSLMKKMGLMAMALSACGDKVTISMENANNIDVHPLKKYTIVTNTSFAPFTFKNYLGEYIGIDVDLLEAIAESQRFTYELVPVRTFEEVLGALDAEEVDGAMAGISITEERTEKYDFSDPYLESGVVMGVAAAKTDINSYEDLANKRVAVARGTISEDFAESIKDKYGFTLVSFDEFTDVYKDVLKGESQALFEDSVVMGYIISLGLELKVVSDIERRNVSAFAVPKGKNPELLEKFNKGLQDVIESGEYQKIMNSYTYLNLIY